MGILAKIRRMHFRDKLSLREIAKCSGLSRNTLRRWLRQEEVVEPVYTARTTKHSRSVPRATAGVVSHR